MTRPSRWYPVLLLRDARGRFARLRASITPRRRPRPARRRFPALRRLRELQLVTSVIPALGINPALRPQWQHRLDTFRTGDYDAKWTPCADAGA